MSYWEFNEMIGRAIPWWVPFVAPVALVGCVFVAAYLNDWWRSNSGK